MNADRVLKLARYAYPEDKDKELRVAYMLGLDRGYEERENEKEETVTDCHQLEDEIDFEWAKCKPIDEGMGLESAIIVNEQFDDIARHFAKWGAEHTFTHHETDESLQEAVTHQMEDEQVIDDYVRRGLDDIVLKYAQLGAKWGAEYRDRFLNYIRDLIKAGIKRPKEALNVLKRIDELINDNTLWEENITQSATTK